jgi:hypothetical protein
MEISTRNLGGLPDVARTKRLLQSMAMLDAVLMPDWQYRYYSFDAHWGKDEMLGSMRDGAGDEFFAVFNARGAFLKGFVHDSPAAETRLCSDRFYSDLPACFVKYSREPAFSIKDVTFCVWRLIDHSAWDHAKVDLPIAHDPDGSASLLSMLDGAPETYRAWAGEYYGRDIPIEAVETLYAHRALTDEVVAALNPQQSVKGLEPDIAEIGYGR